MKIIGLFLAAMSVMETFALAQVPLITNQPASRVLWAGGNVTFNVGVSNAGAFTYQWQLNQTNLPDGIISTVAGAGLSTNDVFTGPYGVTEDASGGLYIADTGDNEIRYVDTNGVVRIVAGNGTADYQGDGGQATNASLNSPYHMTLDQSGNLFIADYQNNAIRKVALNGIITTVAGTGTNGFSGDGGAATNANLNQPHAVFVDTNGNIFIADTLNGRIRKVDTNGIITTVAGGNFGGLGDGAAATNASLHSPCGITFDAYGNMIISDTFNTRVRKVDTNGIITTIAGNGSPIYNGDGMPATSASLGYPMETAIDAAGNLFIADFINNRIRALDTNGIITTVAGGGSGPGSGDGGSATNAVLSFLAGVTVDSSGDVFIADQGENLIRKITRTQSRQLALNRTTATNSGIYQVVITGPGGSVTSSVANLLVATSPQIYRTVRNGDGSVSLNFVTQPGLTNLVQCSTNLALSTGWQPISTNVAGLDGNWQYTDHNATSFPVRFYRSLTLP